MMQLFGGISIVALAILAAAAPQTAEERVGRAIPITKRYSLANTDKSANIDVLKSHVASAQAKIRRGLDNIEMNTGKPHPSAVDRKEVEKRKGGVGLTDYQGQFWYGNIGIGTPVTIFVVEIDTASSDLFVPYVDCDFSCEGHDSWTPTDSSTAKNLNRAFTLSLGVNYTATGQLWTDNVQIAGSVATTQTVGAVTDYGPGFTYETSQYPADGVMGFGFETLSDFNAPSVFQTLVQENQLEEPAFSIKLNESGAELFIGGSNPSMYTGDFSYVNVTSVGYWEVLMDNVLGSGSPILTNVDAIIDIGTSLIMGHLDDVAVLYKALNGKAQPSHGDGYYSFPCDNFPSISFTFGGQSFPISSSLLNIGQVTQGSTDCICGIVGAAMSASFWIIGDIFLQSVYTRFDYSNPSVGFAQLAQIPHSVA